MFHIIARGAQCGAARTIIVEVGLRELVSRDIYMLCTITERTVPPVEEVDLFSFFQGT